MKSVTIHDIARQAEVSIATVSRVLNNNERVGTRTATRIRKVIAETGYVPDNNARGMRQGKTYAIGYIVSDISNVHFTVAAKHLEEVLADAGYSLIVCSTGGDKDRELQHMRLMMAKKVDGLVINTSGKNDDAVIRLSQQLPVVLLSRKIHDSGFNGDFVGSDAFQGAYDLGRHILKNGHRRIGLLRGPHNISTGAERYNGFVTVLKEHGIELPTEWIYQGDFYQQSGWLGAEKLLALKERPSILIALNNAMALGVLYYLKHQGIQVPEDVSFGAFGVISNRELMYVSPAAINENPEEEGKLVGELLKRRLANRNATPMTVLVPAQLLPGNSIRQFA